MQSLCLWFYAGLLRLYPRQFRGEFGAEMKTVFAALLREEMERGAGGFILACLRELRDAPLAALRLRLSRGPDRKSARLLSSQNRADRPGAVAYGVMFVLVNLLQLPGRQWLIQ
ncbi:MAG: hypothetical protein CVU38_05055 [Chloroflexi bacterium HGW-Chloroflexi-1]|nr:MAG: hypothetical protein CVU38_05055 [Chloroflexi bacterium HGW-Chloroflexi-1]